MATETTTTTVRSSLFATSRRPLKSTAGLEPSLAAYRSGSVYRQNGSDKTPVIAESVWKHFKELDKNSGLGRTSFLHISVLKFFSYPSDRHAALDEVRSRLSSPSEEI